MIFWSDRNGFDQVFMQNINQQTAEALVTGPGQARMPRMSPDGAILYVADNPGNTLPRQGPIEWNRIMRVRSSGDTPELVMEVPRLANYACPLPPSDICFVGQFSEDRQKTHIDVFDPVTGKRRELRTVSSHPGVNNNWMPSPDASRIAFSEFNHPGRPHPVALAPGRSGPRHRRQGLGGIQRCELGSGWPIALRFESVTH